MGRRAAASLASRWWPLVGHLRPISTLPDWLTPPKLRRKLAKTCELEVPAHKVFDVVSDVGSYASFVPYCVGSRILRRRSPEEFDAELQIGFRLFKECYVSRVTCRRPRDGEGGFVKAESSGGLCDSLVSLWSFKPTRGGGSCDLSFNVDFEISNPLHAAAIAGFFEQVTLQQMTAFSERAIQLHQRDLRQGRAGAKTPEGRTTPPPGASATAKGLQGDAAAAKDDNRGGSVRDVAKNARNTGRGGDDVTVDIPFGRERLGAVFDTRKVQLEKSSSSSDAAEGNCSTLVVGLGLPEFLLSCHDLASDREAQRPFRRLSQNMFLLASCFASLDRNGDGVVEEGDWVRGCELLCEQDVARRAAMLHAYFDGNGDGLVSAGDVSGTLGGHLKSMRRLMPELLRMQERRDLPPIAALSPPPPPSATNNTNTSSSVPESLEDGGCSTNMLVLCATMDVVMREAEGEVSDFVDSLFELIDPKGAEKERGVTRQTWVARMEQHPGLMNLMFLDGFLELTELALVTKESVEK